jgi:hypothetical protein
VSLLVTALWAAAGPQQQPVGTSSVAGRVFDEHDEPVVGFWVEAWPRISRSSGFRLEADTRELDVPLTGVDGLVVPLVGTTRVTGSVVLKGIAR